MSCHEVRTFEWKCDCCGQKVMSRGINVEESRPEEFGSSLAMNCFKDVCVSCWDTLPESDEKVVLPKILLPIFQKVS